MRAYLRRLRRETLPREMPGFWSSWAQTAAALGYDDLKMEVAVLTKDELLDAMDFSLEDFDAAMANSRATTRAGFAGFHNQKCVRLTTRSGRSKLGAAAATISSWTTTWLRIPMPSSRRRIRPRRPTSIPFRDVGRNDPCPCGSGKKYKKCCLAA